ncbi:hypothetical protein BOTBODRAFT_110755 [Botryobasidium botryosum FD-172 SS1]|uniref:Protein kinase domain-containing protein n=1 Tax=Botryobasidium botryosum (strain FD-172 SS1) TaxID=930990 RepID=A0A067MPY1_BOTB1|nr:hypothetical protein BOTBODRAFT_110755 [Botryobasidium botryosum FD-172 SS1]
MPRSCPSLDINHLAQEAEIWNHLNHPNVLPFLGLCALDLMLFLVSPWMENGNAFDFVRGNADADCLQLLAQVAKGLDYLHTFEPPVIHGDLRGCNILVSETGDARIADFGLSELSVYIADYYRLHERETCPPTNGHPRWQAAEIIVAETGDEARRTVATDVFAFGRVMLELFTKKVPFSYIPLDFTVAIVVIRGEFPQRPWGNGIEDRGLGDDMWELMLHCWDIDPSQRPDAKGIVAQLSTALEARGKGDPPSRSKVEEVT